jgi:hypothetical protein
MPNHSIIQLNKEFLSKKIIKDLHEFFDDNHIQTKKIMRHGDTGTIKFYEIHFDNRPTVDIDVISKLDKYGYTPKSLHACLPNSFYLLVLVNKKI